MSERYCGFILIMPGKNRISIARCCLPLAGTSTSWCFIVHERDEATEVGQSRILFHIIICDSKLEVCEMGRRAGIAGSNIAPYYSLQTAICFLFQGS